jgi:hypothetical protein
MIGRNKIDTLWMGVGPGYKLMTVCNCCPCCCLFKTLPNLDVTHIPHPSVLVFDNYFGKGHRLKMGFSGQEYWFTGFIKPFQERTWSKILLSTAISTLLTKGYVCNNRQ